MNFENKIEPIEQADNENQMNKREQIKSLLKEESIQCLKHHFQQLLLFFY